MIYYPLFPYGCSRGNQERSCDHHTGDNAGFPPLLVTAESWGLS